MLAKEITRLKPIPPTNNIVRPVINIASLTLKEGYIGILGKFKFHSTGNIKRIPSIYRVKNEKLYKMEY